MVAFAPLRRLCPFLVAFIVVCIPSYAAQMNAVVGFDGTAKKGMWAPITVRIENPSGSELQGMLAPEPTQGADRVSPVCGINALLPANSKKLYHVYTRLPDRGDTLNVSLLRAFGVRDTKYVKMNIADTDDKLIVTVGPRSSRLSFLAGEKLPAVRQTSSGYSNEVSIYAGSIAPDELPERPAAYESVDVLVVPPDLPSSATTAAVKAVAMWVASGGTLVVTSGPDYRKCANDFCDELLPVKVTGEVDLEGMRALAGVSGTPFPAGRAAVAANSLKPVIGEAVVAQGATPLVAERSYGAGKVVFLAFDPLTPPFHSWNGQIGFWKSILRSSDQKPMLSTGEPARDPRTYYDPEQVRQSAAMSSVVERNPRIKTPPLATIGCFLLAYLIVLVPVNYAVLKRRRRLELAWLSTPIIVAVFTVGAYGFGYTMKGGRLQLRQATFVEGSSNARYARAVTDASLFSPGRRSYNITLSDPVAICQALPTSRKEALPLALLGDQAAIVDVPLAMWSSRTFESTSGRDLGGTLKADLTLNGNVLQGQIRNDTNLDLRDCFVVYGGQEYPVGKLGKGAIATLGQAQPIGRVLGPEYRESRYGYPDGSDFAGSLAENLQDFARTRAASSEHPILVATSGGSDVFAVDGGRASTDSATICVFRLDYSAGGSFSVRTDNGTVIESDNSGSAPEYDDSLDKVVPLACPGYAIVQYSLPVPSGSVVTVLGVHAQVVGGSGGSSGGAPKFASWIYNFSTQTWDSTNISAGATFADASRYVGPGDTVRVKVKSQTQGDMMRLHIAVDAQGKRR